MPKILLFASENRSIVNKLRALLFNQADDAVERAAEIVEDEYFGLLKEAGSFGITDALLGTEVKKESHGSGRNRVISVFVPKEGGGSNRIFHVLNEGRDEPLLASDFGHKVWPMVKPRRRKYGNVPMTDPGSPAIHQAVSNEDIIYRPVMGPVAARNFTEDILQKAEKRMREEGLDKFVGINTSEF